MRSPILKCKIFLASNHMALLQNQPVLCTSISDYQCCLLSTHQSHQHCCNTLLNLLYSHSLQYCCSISADQPLLIPICQSAHQHLFIYSSIMFINNCSSTHQQCEVCSAGHASLFIILWTSKLFINIEECASSSSWYLTSS